MDLDYVMISEKVHLTFSIYLAACGIRKLKYCCSYHLLDLNRDLPMTINCYAFNYF